MSQRITSLQEFLATPRAGQFDPRRLAAQAALESPQGFGREGFQAGEDPAFIQSVLEAIAPPEGAREGLGRLGRAAQEVGTRSFNIGRSLLGPSVPALPALGPGEQPVREAIGETITALRRPPRKLTPKQEEQDLAQKSVEQVIKEEQADAATEQLEDGVKRARQNAREGKSALAQRGEDLRSQIAQQRAMRDIAEGFGEIGRAGLELARGRFLMAGVNPDLNIDNQFRATQIEQNLSDLQDQLQRQIAKEEDPRFDPDSSISVQARRTAGIEDPNVTAAEIMQTILPISKLQQAEIAAQQARIDKKAEIKRKEIEISFKRLAKNQERPKLILREVRPLIKRLEGEFPGGELRGQIITQLNTIFLNAKGTQTEGDIARAGDVGLRLDRRLIEAFKKGVFGQAFTAETMPVIREFLRLQEATAIGRAKQELANEVRRLMAKDTGLTREQAIARLRDVEFGNQLMGRYFVARDGKIEEFGGTDDQLIEQVQKGAVTLVNPFDRRLLGLN